MKFITESWWARVVLSLACVAILPACEVPWDDDDDDDTPPPTFAGTYSGTDFQLDCDIGGTITPTIPPSTWTADIQVNGVGPGATVTAAVTVIAPAETFTGNLNGTLTSLTSFDFTLAITSATCSVSVSGTATLSGNTLTIVFSGSADCCAGGTISGSATATKN